MKTYPENEKKSIKQWAEDDRPREKMLSKGKASLSDAELIAILIGSGNTNESAVELSRRILNSVADNLVELSRLSVAELTRFKGIGEAKAISIVAALELGRRRRSAEAQERKAIKSSNDAFEYFYASLADLHYEQFWIMLLNQSHKVIRIVQVSDGGLSGTVADPKRIFKLAIESNAAAMILCHNHPSGQLKASDADINLTKKLAKSGDLLDIRVVDHLIIGHDNYLSFADEGMLPIS
ncbi:MAG: DNA repair protein RadC [Bacteroidetes bacterium]|jgi:DNA repair protein RadC|nr:DNA repair protein RadC [Bacteroidota bacterium]MBU1580954.1 DNA repair protein RadC [Bacteroidota bacterium]MBU2466827.1 DNA repair protein RadC [Bacteroidota bacterium]MBU2557744.1 DNA repair protein RadC [Bacteroidota bacterium]MDA3943748.1 DNA repair protein RadC [Bacteroidota bacterium]